MRKGYEENLLKRFLKRKVKVTLGMVVAFLISGNIGYASPVEVQIGDNNGTDFVISSSKGNGKYNFTNTENTSIDIKGNGGFTVKGKNGTEGKTEFEFNGDTTFISSNVNKYIGSVLKLDGRGGNVHLNINGNNNNLSFKDKDNNIFAAISSSSLGKPYESFLRIENINDLNINLNRGGSLGIDISKGKGIITANNDIRIHAERSAINAVNGIIELNSKNIYLGSGEEAADTVVSNSESTVKMTATEKIKIDSNTVKGRALESTFGSDINLTARSVELIGKDAIFSGNDSGVDNFTKENQIILKADNYKIYGDIIALRKNSIISISEKSSETNGNNKIALNEKQIENYKINGTVDRNYIRVVSVNNSDINLNLLGNESILIGRLDDYTGFDIIKRNEILDNRGNDKANSSGKINLKMNENGIWVAKGKSYLTSLSIDKSYIDLSTDKTSNLIHTNKIEGNGTFTLNIDTTENRNGSMLYIKAADNSSENTIDIKNIDLKNFEIGEQIRFATVGKDAKNNVTFKDTTIYEKGIKNVKIKVDSEKFDKNDLENEVYNKDNNQYIEENYIDGENWYITREKESGNEDINDGGLIVIEMARANYSSAVYMDNLNKRLGDMTFANGNSGIWVRIRNDRVGEDNEYRLHNYMTQIGYDKIYSLENGTEYRGIAFDYADGQMEYKNLEGESDIDRYTVTLYDTRLYNSGVYADYTVRAGYMESEFDIRGRETGNQVKGEYDNLILGVGAEFGKRYNFGETSYFEPQIQLQYTYIDDTDYTTNQDTKVNYDEIHSLIGRAGIRLGHDFYKENSKDNTVYLKIDANHEFLGDQDVKAQDLTGTLNETYHNDNTWYDIGIGGAKNLTEDLYVYADMERQFGHKDNSWQFNLGFRYKFGSLKDFTFNTTNLFDFDKSIVKPEGKEMIKNASQIIDKKRLKGTLVIEGHTDWTGTEEYNQILSEKRAKAVREEFESNITNENIKYESKGYGETKPIATNRIKEGRAKNRRVDIKYIKD